MQKYLVALYSNKAELVTHLLERTGINIANTASSKVSDLVKTVNWNGKKNYNSINDYSMFRLHCPLLWKDIFGAFRRESMSINMIQSSTR